MNPSDTALAFSRLVKIAVATIAVGLLPVILGLQMLLGGVGATTRDHVANRACEAPNCSLTTTARDLVGDLEDRGMACREAPALTDTVVFAWNDGRVETVDFGTSLSATSRGEGSALRYCMTPR